MSKNEKNIKKNSENKEFSKKLLEQEKILVWIVTLAALGITIFCIARAYTGALPWLATIVGFPWSAYGISQACYYNKAKAENTKGGIKYDSIINSLTNTIHSFNSSPSDNDEGIDPFGPI